MFRDKIYFTLNGKPVEISGKNVFAPLSDTLRYQLQQTGTKVVCAEGDCGACTVMLSRARSPGFYSINSCIYPTFSADGCHIVTVEGLATDRRLTEVQDSMARNFGGQCGFCTPGFVMSITNMYERKENPSEQNVKNYLTGNLCRCTGYQPIIQAALDVDTKKHERLCQRYSLAAESRALILQTDRPIMIETPERALCAPLTLEQAAEFKQSHPQARVFSGATDIGVQINKGKNPGREQLSLHLIDELYEITSHATSIHVGAKVTLSQLQNYLEKSQPEFAQFLNIFASPQIKNSATLVGNLANGSPIADTTPYLLATDAIILIEGPRGVRELAATKFFKGYKTFHLEPDEIISGIKWTRPEENKIGLYKVSQRRDLDISCVNACFVFQVDDNKITSARIAYGGVGPVPLRLTEVERAATGKPINSHTANELKTLIENSVQPQSDLRGSLEFRKLMAGQLFQKFYEEKLRP